MGTALCTSVFDGHRNMHDTRVRTRQPMARLEFLAKLSAHFMVEYCPYMLYGVHISTQRKIHALWKFWNK